MEYQLNITKKESEELISNKCKELVRVNDLNDYLEQIKYDDTLKLSYYDDIYIYVRC